MNNLISIIIPTFNRAHIIGETLDSIQMQQYKDWECIIVDDGSTDNTQPTVERYCGSDSRFIFLQRPPTVAKGANACRNYGFQKASGKFIVWLDSDDLLKPEALQTIISRFDITTDAVVSNVIFTELSTGKIFKENVTHSDNLIADYITGKISYYICGPVWRKSFLENKVLFDPAISNLDDWDFNLRMIYEKPSIVVLQEPLIYYRIHSGSLSAEIKKLNEVEIKSEFFARKKHLDILKEIDRENYYVLLNFTLSRYKYVLRDALVQHHPMRFPIFSQYMLLLIKCFKILEAIQTTVAYILFRIFKKGYKLLS